MQRCIADWGNFVALVEIDASIAAAELPKRLDVSARRLMSNANVYDAAR